MICNITLKNNKTSKNAFEMRMSNLIFLWFRERASMISCPYKYSASHGKSRGISVNLLLLQSTIFQNGAVLLMEQLHTSGQSVNQI